MQPGTTKPEEGADHQQWNVMSNPADRTLILVHVQFIQKILRRRPFMIKSLENVIRRTVQSLVRIRTDWAHNLRVHTRPLTHILSYTYARKYACVSIGMSTR